MSSYDTGRRNVPRGSAAAILACAVALLGSALGAHTPSGWGPGGSTSHVTNDGVEMQELGVIPGGVTIDLENTTNMPRTYRVCYMRAPQFKIWTDVIDNRDLGTVTIPPGATVTVDSFGAETSTMPGSYGNLPAGEWCNGFQLKDANTGAASP